MIRTAHKLRFPTGSHGSSTFTAVLEHLSRLTSYQITNSSHTQSNSSQVTTRFSQDTANQSQATTPDFSVEECLDSQRRWANTSFESACLTGARMTPAQVFYLTNKELMNTRAREFVQHKRSDELSRVSEEHVHDWAFNRHPVVRKPRGYCWPQSEATVSVYGNDENENFPLDSGEIPTVDEMIQLMRLQGVVNIVAFDLALSHRRDIGEWVIIGTVKSSIHAVTVAHILRKHVIKYSLENMNCNISAIRGQEWVAVRSGPMVVHLMTASDRAKYDLEDMYRIPALDTVDSVKTCNM